MEPGSAQGIRERIAAAQRELREIGVPHDSAGVIDKANLIRANELLHRSDDKKSELIRLHAEYARMLEDMLDSLLDVQTELTVMLRGSIARRAPRAAGRKKARSRTRAAGTRAPRR